MGNRPFSGQKKGFYLTGFFGESLALAVYLGYRTTKTGLLAERQAGGGAQSA
jgi:hypothetical protein